jgi:HAD superfamily hydrolase (TIGR01484 family)
LRRVELVREARILVATDLDRTLLPNGPQPESPGARALFSFLVARPEVTLAYVSGRHRALVEEAIAEFSLPQPDFVIGDVGTSIYQVDAPGHWIQPTDWESSIARDWSGLGHQGLAELLQDVDALVLQPPDRQNHCKLSYFVSLEYSPDALEPEVAARLRGVGIAARLIWSVDEPAGIGLLDILPARASKLHALEALMAFKGFDLTDTVFCGDSGNDLEVLASPVPAVLVANAQPEVQAEAARRTVQAGWPDRLYIARGGYLDLTGNYSGGMLEGIAHYHPQITDWLQAMGSPGSH